MNRLWTKIGLGAFSIFALGMLLITLLRDARDSVREELQAFLGPDDAAAATTPEVVVATAPEAASSPVVEVAQTAHAAQLAHMSHGLAALGARLASLRAGHAKAAHQMPFRLDGDRLGSIQQLTIRRAHKGELPDVTLLVVLSDPSSASRLAHCDLVPAAEDDVSGDEGFTCADADATDLLTVGRARIEPLGIERPIRVSEDAAVDMRNGDPFEVNATAGGDVRVSARGDHGGGVQVLADDRGASIKVDDALGRSIVRLLADSNGAMFRLRDKNGREVMRMDAGQGGFSLSIDTSGVK